MANTHEAAARAAKAQKLVDAVTRELRRQGVGLPAALPALERWGAEAWAKVAVLAACRPPSEATRAEVLATLRRVASETPCATCGSRNGGHAGWCSTEQWHAEQRRAAKGGRVIVGVTANGVPVERLGSPTPGSLDHLLAWFLNRGVVVEMHKALPPMTVKLFCESPQGGYEVGYGRTLAEALVNLRAELEAADG